MHGYTRGPEHLGPVRPAACTATHEALNTWAPSDLLHPWLHAGPSAPGPPQTCCMHGYTRSPQYLGPVRPAACMATHEALNTWAQSDLLHARLHTRPSTPGPRQTCCTHGNTRGPLHLGPARPAACTATPEALNTWAPADLLHEWLHPRPSTPGPRRPAACMATPEAKQ